MRKNTKLRGYDRWVKTTDDDGAVHWKRDLEVSYYSCQDLPEGYTAAKGRESGVKYRPVFERTG